MFSSFRSACVAPSILSQKRKASQEMDIKNGVAWAALASGHMASFDRRKCRGPLNGPKATGQRCPNGRIDNPNSGWKGKGLWAT
jgi:hypothetical protein